MCDRDQVHRWAWRHIEHGKEQNVEVVGPAVRGVKAIGVNEHIWRPAKISSTDKAVTVMVDLTRDELPDATAVLDAFHVVKLAGSTLDEVRRRAQQTTLGRRGHKNDPLYRIRRTLLTGVEHLTDRQRQRLQTCLPAGDPDGEVELAWQVYQQVRAVYHASTPARGRELAELLDTLHTCPIDEVARLGRTLRQWRHEILAYFATGGVSNGGTEAINGIIEKTRRLAHGFRNFTNYRIRILLAADGSRPYRRHPRPAPQPC